MREGALGSGARDVEFPDCRADRLERTAGVPDRRLLRLGACPETRDGVIGVLHLAAQPVERSHVGIQPGLTSDDIVAEVVDTPMCVVSLDGQGHGTGLELGAGFLEPLYFRGKRSRALNKRRMSRAGFGSALIQRLGILPRLEHPALSADQTFVRRLLIAFEPGDRQTRFLLASVERVAFL